MVRLDKQGAAVIEIIIVGCIVLIIIGGIIVGVRTRRQVNPVPAAAYITGPQDLKAGEKGTYYLTVALDGISPGMTTYLYNIYEDDVGNEILIKDIKVDFPQGKVTKTVQFELECTKEGHLKGKDGASADETEHQVFADGHADTANWCVECITEDGE